MQAANFDETPAITPEIARVSVERAASQLISAAGNHMLALASDQSAAPLQESAVRQQMESHLAAIVAALPADAAQLLTAYVQTLIASGNAPQAVRSEVEILGQTIRKQLGEAVWSHTRAALDPALEWLASQTGSGTLSPILQMADLVQQYTHSILSGDRIQAQKLVFGALDQGRTIRDVYLNILQPSLYEVGRRWEIGQISIAQEHLATAITQSVLSAIYAQVTLPASLDQHAVVACLQGNFHEIGPRMLADFLQMAGYNARFLGTDTSFDHLTEMIQTLKPSVVGLPATTQSQVDNVKRAIDRIRADFASYRPVIMVGGLAFNLVDGLWKTIEADLWREDGGQAVDELVGSSDWS